MGCGRFNIGTSGRAKAVVIPEASLATVSKGGTSSLFCLLRQHPFRNVNSPVGMYFQSSDLSLPEFSSIAAVSCSAVTEGNVNNGHERCLATATMLFSLRWRSIQRSRLTPGINPQEKCNRDLIKPCPGISLTSILRRHGWSRRYQPEYYESETIVKIESLLSECLLADRKRCSEVGAPLC